MIIINCTYEAFNMWFTSQTTIIMLSMNEQKAIAVALLSDHIALSSIIILWHSHVHIKD